MSRAFSQSDSFVPSWVEPSKPLLEAECAPLKKTSSTYPESTAGAKSGWNSPPSVAGDAMYGE